MHLPYFVLLVIGTLAAIAAGLAMLTFNYHVARLLFCIAAIAFGSLGVVWSATSEGYSLKTQLIVSAIIGAIAAAGLTWTLWEIREKENSEKPRGDEAHASATTTQPPTPPPTGPTPEANSDGRISAPGATIPGDLPLGKAEMVGIIDVPGTNVARQADGGTTVQPSNTPVTRTFPPPTAEFQSFSNEELKQRAKTIAADLRNFQERFSTALQERPKGPETGLAESSDQEFYERWKTEYETKHINEAYSLVSEYLARGHSITPSAEMEVSGGNILFHKAFEGPDAALRVAAFLDRLAND